MDWIACFPGSHTCLESLIFDCVDCLVNFDALERLVVRSPSLKKLRLNRYVSIGQLYRLMIRAPQLTHLGTGSFSTSDGMIQGEQEADYASAFAACKSLTCLSGFRETLPELLPAIYPVCANLTSLNFSYANINAEQLKPVICHCHKLQTFWVCAKLTVVFLLTFVKTGLSDAYYLCFSSLCRLLIRYAMKGCRL